MKILFLALLFATQNLFADAQTLSKYEKKVGEVVFSLENIKNGSVLDSFDQGNLMAAEAMSVMVAAEISERILAASELIVLIDRDKNLSEKQKVDLVRKIGVRLADLYMIVIRHHGDDELDSLEDKSGVLTKYTKKTLKEMKNTFTQLLGFPKTAEGKRIPIVWDRMIREYVSQSANIDMQKMMLALAENSESVINDRMRMVFDVPPEEKERPTEMGTAEKALYVRQDRLTAHYTVLATIGLSTLTYLTIFPGVDYVGAMVGYYDVTPVYSDAIAAGVATFIGLVRSASGSFKAIPGIKRLLEIIRKPEIPHEASKMNLPLLAKALRVQKKMEEARKAVLSGRSCKVLLPK